MMKNRFMMAFAFVGLLGLTACGGAEEEAVVEEPVIEEPAVAPIVEPAPLPMDSAAMPMDSAALPADTAAL